MNVRLRTATDDDAALLERWRDAAAVDDPWGYFPDAELSDFSAADGRRMIVEAEGQPVGDVSWHTVRYGPNEASSAWNIGISLQPSERGRGIGTQAQRMLAVLLFATTQVNRVEASTDVENVAEQRALTKAGFTREGVYRGAQYRAGVHRDLVGYAVLRGELPA